MLDISKVCALVPFRSGSKGLQNKNIKSLLGRPLFSYSLRFAQYLSIKSVISTDYDANVLAPYIGDGIYIKRPAELSGDATPIEEVIKHALEDTAFSQFDYCLLLQPTSPLRSSIVFHELLNKFLPQADETVCLSITKKTNSLWKTGFLEKGKLRNISGKNENFFANRQSLPNLYAPDGNMYLFSIDQFKKHLNFSYSSLTAVLNVPLASFDIDTAADLELVGRAIKETDGVAGFEWLGTDLD